MMLSRCYLSFFIFFICGRERERAGGLAKPFNIVINFTSLWLGVRGAINNSVFPLLVHIWLPRGFLDRRRICSCVRACAREGVRTRAPPCVRAERTRNTSVRQRGAACGNGDRWRLRRRFFLSFLELLDTPKKKKEEIKKTGKGGASYSLFFLTKKAEPL